MNFTLTLTLGAALLAVWLDGRFADRRPQSPSAAMTHGAIGALAVLGAAGLLVLVYGIPQAAFMAILLCTFLPALVYALLAGLWMLRALAELTGFARR
ncbi:MAG TPA: hypothetical protein VNR59_03990 [Gaiellaceae bacterium]|jgi:hypothetical protein|nr:hypothetical protein [Gaiellaceae bacterium]